MPGAKQKKPLPKRKPQAKGSNAPAVSDASAPRDLISFDEAAKILGVSRRKIERLCQSGDLHTYKKLFVDRRDRDPKKSGGRLPRLLDRAEVLKIAESAEPAN